MGQKTHPKGFRLGITENWDSRWFAKQDYARILHQDLKIREFIREYNQRHDATVMLTSHYMDDVVALCPRVIVIDGGRIIHDGDLRALVKSMMPDKRVSFRGEVAEAQLARLGRVVSRDAGRTTLEVPEDHLREVIGHGPATGASLEVEPDRLRVRLVEFAVQVFRQPVNDMVVCHAAYLIKRSRSAMRARCNCDFDVPLEIPSSSPISSCR